MGIAPFLITPLNRLGYNNFKNYGHRNILFITPFVDWDTFLFSKTNVAAFLFIDSFIDSDVILINIGEKVPLHLSNHL